jgi:phosphoesterase RecJ-like protein
MFHQVYGSKNNTFKEIWKELKKSKKILLTLHPKPDGDSLGSCTAMKYVLEKRGINIRLISKDPLNENLGSYSFSKEVEFGIDIEKLDLNEFDCILLLDSGSFDYMGFSEEFRNKLKGKKIINIDHHATNTYYGNLNYVNSELPSCCSVLYEFFDRIRFRFDKELSLRLLLGICTDTAFFIHGDSIDSLKKAIILLEKGKINYKKELYNIITDDSWKLKKFHGLLLTNMKKVEINGNTVAYSWATKKEYEKLGLNGSDITAGISCMQNIKGLNLIFSLVEIKGEIKGAFRSRGLDTTIYSTVFGGGGHKEASGFVLKTPNMKKAIKEILRVIKEKGFVSIENNSS